MTPNFPLLKAIALGAAMLACEAYAAAPTYQYRQYSAGVRAEAIQEGSPETPAPETPVPEVQRTLGELRADTSADFGALATGVTATRSFTFTNIGALPITGAFAQIPQVVALRMTSNTCGTATAATSLEPGQECRVSLSYGSSESSRLEGASLSIAGAFEASPATQVLLGSVGGFDAVAQWSTVPSSVIPLSAADMSFGTVAKGAVASKMFYFINTGTRGQQAVGITVSGDTSQFSGPSIIAGSNRGVAIECERGGVYTSANRLSVTPCLVGFSYNRAYTGISYRPTEVGHHSITLTPTTDNGTKLPGAITITGSAAFDVRATWTTGGTSFTAIPPAGVDYGVVAVGKSTGKYINLQTSGSYGAASLGYTFSGDIDQFELSPGTLVRSGNGQTYENCGAGTGMLSADKLSVSPCSVRLGSSLQSLFYYKPKRAGAHSMTITPITLNGATLPAPLVLRGSSN